jgi:hypothetical protein
MVADPAGASARMVMVIECSRNHDARCRTDEVAARGEPAVEYNADVARVNR